MPNEVRYPGGVVGGLTPISSTQIPRYPSTSLDKLRDKSLGINARNDKV